MVSLSCYDGVSSEQTRAGAVQSSSRGGRIAGDGAFLPLSSPSAVACIQEQGDNWSHGVAKGSSVCLARAPWVLLADDVSEASLQISGYLYNYKSVRIVKLPSCWDCQHLH